jgi:hypothetical protein
MITRDLAADVRRALSDPKALAEKLGLKVEKNAGSYVLVCCPVHAERTASLSIRRTDTGVGCKCFGCDWKGDALSLVAATLGLDTRREFREVLAQAAELAGMPDEAREVRGGAPAPERRPRPVAPPTPERDYPTASEVALLWSACVPVSEDHEVSALLAMRGISVSAVVGCDAARALAVQTHHSSIPGWARYRGTRDAAEPWTRTGHRLILPTYDALGEMRSVRAWLVRPDDCAPKRLPPSGCRASDLVVASREGVRMLRGESFPRRVIICEGEPDALVRMVRNPLDAVIGIMSGSWSPAFAARIPYGSQVVVRTHLDKAGGKYADAVVETLRGRAIVSRRVVETEAA